MKVDRGSPVLFHNATIHTVDDVVPRADWFVVLGDRFQRLGRGPTPEVVQSIDLRGRTVVPGFVDSHVHFFQAGIDSLFVDLAGCRSLDEVRQRLVNGLRGTRSWLFAQGFQEDSLKDAKRLTRDHLDDWFGDRPVWVGRVDYHSAVVNTSALKRLAIPKDLRGFLFEEGEPVGIIRSEAFMFARQRVTQAYPIETKEKAVKAAAHDCVKRGITAVHALEGGELFGDEGVAMVLRKAPKLPLDITVFLQEKNAYMTTRLGFQHLGGCILIDGSIGSYTAALDHGYHSAPSSRGVLYEKTRELRSFISEAHQTGVQLAFHAIGPRAIEQLLDAYERALARHPRYDHRHRIEHFELATDDQIARARDLGLIPAMQPAFEYYWGGAKGMYAARLGKGWRQTNRFRTILDAGLRIAGGSDANVTPADPLLGIHAAVNHPNPEQRITAVEALRMMTLDSAYAGFNERRHGSISAGKEANFVVLGADPLRVRKRELKSIPVEETWYLGRRVFAAN